MAQDHPGRIDEALLKRPSRFDRVFHLGLPAIEERRRYCERLLESIAGKLSSRGGSPPGARASRRPTSKRSSSPPPRKG